MLVGIDPGVTRLGGEMVNHDSTDVRPHNCGYIIVVVVKYNMYSWLLFN